MSRMQDEFHTDVEKAFRKAAKHRDVVAKIKKHADNNSELLATRIVEIVPDRLRETRVAVFEAFGVDLADSKAVRNYKASSVAEWQIISWHATRYQVYSAFLRLVGQYALDPTLTGVRSAQAVCKAFIEAMERHLHTVVLDFDELYKKVPKEGFPEEELAKVLSGIVATRTSLHMNPRLRAAIDGCREHSRGKSARRERFEALLKELPAEVLDVWKETAHPLGTLSEIRTEVARRLEQQSSKRSVEVELAAFADREKLLKRAKGAGLTPREYQLFSLVLGNPERLLRRNYKLNHSEAAQAMGVAVGTTKSLWSRTKKKIFAA